MRTVLLFLASLFSTVVIAQQPDKTGQPPSETSNKWEISLNFTHRTNQRITNLPTFREVNPSDIPISMRSGLDTISISGMERVFRRTVPGEVFIDASSPGFWFGTQLRLHRRLNRNFRLTAGVHYDQLAYNSRDANGNIEAPGVVNTIQPVLYPVADISEYHVGVVFHADYHLFPEARLHPFFGFGGSGLFSRQSNRPVGQIYSPEPEQLITRTTTEVITSAFEFDFLTTGGLLYRLHEKWYVGLTVSSRIGSGSGTLGVQVRCVL